MTPHIFKEKKGTNISLYHYIYTQIYEQHFQHTHIFYKIFVMDTEVDPFSILLCCPDTVAEC